MLQDQNTVCLKARGVSIYPNELGGASIYRTVPRLQYGTHIAPNGHFSPSLRMPRGLLFCCSPAFRSEGVHISAGLCAARLASLPSSSVITSSP